MWVVFSDTKTVAERLWQNIAVSIDLTIQALNPFRTETVC